jgi:hypothetical protein
MSKPLHWMLAAVMVAAAVTTESGLARDAAAAENDAFVAFELCTPEGPGADEKCAAFGLPAV